MKKLIIFAVLILSTTIYAQEYKEDTTIYNAVEVSAEFPQGIKCFYEYLIENGKFDTEGKMIVQFVVEKNGTITDIYIHRQIDSESTYEVIRLLNECPKWNSGIQNGQKVRQRFVLPLTVIK